MKKPILWACILLLVFVGIICFLFFQRTTNNSNDLTFRTEQDKHAFSTGKLDINAANAEQLSQLPGIGETLAERIVEYRRRNGPFQSIDNILNIKGVGQKVFAQVKDLITVIKPK